MDARCGMVVCRVFVSTDQTIKGTWPGWMDTVVLYPTELHPIPDDATRSCSCKSQQLGLPASLCISLLSSPAASRSHHEASCSGFRLKDPSRTSDGQARTCNG